MNALQQYQTGVHSLAMQNLSSQMALDEAQASVEEQKATQAVTDLGSLAQQHLSKYVTEAGVDFGVQKGLTKLGAPIGRWMMRKVGNTPMPKTTQFVNDVKARWSGSKVTADTETPTKPTSSATTKVSEQAEDATPESQPAISETSLDATAKAPEVEDDPSVPKMSDISATDEDMEEMQPRTFTTTSSSSYSMQRPTQADLEDDPFQPTAGQPVSSGRLTTDVGSDAPLETQAQKSLGQMTDDTGPGKVTEMQDLGSDGKATTGDLSGDIGAGEAAEAVDIPAETAAMTASEVLGSVGSAISTTLGVAAPLVGLGMGIYSIITEKEQEKSEEDQINQHNQKVQALQTTIDSDQFQQKVGARPPAYGSLAAPGAQQVNSFATHF